MGERLGLPAEEPAGQDTREIASMPPITVLEYPEGGYELIDGRHRWLAHRRAGLETVPAFIRGITD